MDGRPPRRDWVLLPPWSRPVAAVLSVAIAALVVWDQFGPKAQPERATDYEAVKVAPLERAPVSLLDVSGPIRRGEEPEGPAPSVPSAPGRAKGRPLEAQDAPPPGGMTEEQRSARNEELIADLERQKRRMGVVRLEPARPSRTRLLEPGPELPAVAGAPGLLKEPGLGRSAPAELLVLADARALASAWAVLGLPGEPPGVDFARERAVLLKTPDARILSAEPAGGAIRVAYRRIAEGEASDPSLDRFVAVPRRPAAVVAADETPAR